MHHSIFSTWPGLTGAPSQVQRGVPICHYYLSFLAGKSILKGNDLEKQQPHGQME